MAVTLLGHSFITGRDEYVCLTGDTKPDNCVAGSILSEIDGDNVVAEYLYDGDKWINKAAPEEIEPNPPELIIGLATGGTNGTLVDSTKDFGVGSLNGQFIKIVKEGMEYIRAITDTAGSTISFSDLQSSTNATVTLGTGQEPEGQIEITVIAAGADGNKYSIELVQGDTDTGTDFISMEGNVITITCDTNGSSEPRELMAGNIETLINDTEVINGIFSADEMFTAGEIPMTLEAVQFAGGDDGVYVEADDAYTVCKL